LLASTALEADDPGVIMLWGPQPKLAPPHHHDDDDTGGVVYMGSRRRRW
jgi:hypothetical protein